MLYKIKSFFHRINLFFYYGNIGQKYCYDYDGESFWVMGHAAFKRTKDFLHSNETHLLCNEDIDGRHLRKCRELELLLKWKADGGESCFNTGLVYNKYPKRDIFNSIEDDQDCNFKKDFKIALKKDRQIAVQRNERLIYLINNHLSGFWD